MGVDDEQIVPKSARHIGDRAKSHETQQCGPTEHHGLTIGIGQKQAGFEGNVLGDIAWVDPAADFISPEFEFGYLESVCEGLRGKMFDGWSVPVGDGLGERFEVLGWVVGH